MAEKTVEVSAKCLMYSGIKGFDALMPGLPFGSTVLLVGPPGSGKSILCKQFIYEGLQEGQHCLLVATEQNKKGVFEDMRNLNMNVEPYFRQGLLKIVDVHSWVSGLKPVEEENVYQCSTPADLNDLSVGITYAVRELPAEQPKRLAFDSVSTLFIHNPPENVLKFVEILRGRLNSAWFTSLFAVEEGPHPANVASALNAIADGTICLGFEGEKRFLTVPKMRTMPSISAKIPFRITDCGIAVVSEPFKPKKKPRKRR